MEHNERSSLLSSRTWPYSPRTSKDMKSGFESFPSPLSWKGSKCQKKKKNQVSRESRLVFFYEWYGIYLYYLGLCLNINVTKTIHIFVVKKQEFGSVCMTLKIFWSIRLTCIFLETNRFMEWSFLYYDNGTLLPSLVKNEYSLSSPWLPVGK